MQVQSVADSLKEARARLFTFTPLDPSQWKTARTTDEIDKTFVAFSAIFHGAIDLVAKRGVSAGSVTGQPIQFLPI